ncbi:hypothetical protein GCM10022276_27230 [Sphingomonas limnosediminicola]|jgi:hypothetical protein|uniref:DUF2530 domain-containing protein n=2 Tax=Sphingomonas limnosediminicola TaxID=940133 RepID=A0ABP7LTG2_9SPHN
MTSYVPAPMRHEAVSNTAAGRVDWKGLGYLISIVSVVLLSAIAWPKSGDPGWHLPLLLAGMTTSIIGMGCRYKAHLDEQREIKKAKAEARSR